MAVKVLGLSGPKVQQRVAQNDNFQNRLRPDSPILHGRCLAVAAKVFALQSDLVFLGKGFYIGLGFRQCLRFPLRVVSEIVPRAGQRHQFDKFRV